MTRRLIVTDPIGFTHIVEFADQGISASAVYGAENLAHGQPRELRDALLGELLDRMRLAGHGTYRGYVWHET